MQTIGFQNPESDLDALNRMYDALARRGLTPEEAAAHVLASMANQAIASGMDPTKVTDAMHQVITKIEQPKPKPVKRLRTVMSDKQVKELRRQMNVLRNLLLYWDMVLCSEIQRYAFLSMDKIKEKGLYRHELKQYVNKLNNESRVIQMRVKDTDRLAVLKWCNRIDKRGIYTNGFYEDRASIASKFVLAFQDKFKSCWNVVQMDCREISKATKCKQEELMYMLFTLETLTNTGVELYDECVKRMKSMMSGKGTFNIRKSLHHESMRNAVRNLIRELGGEKIELTDTQLRYAREHLRDMQTFMIKEGLNDFFQQQFDALTTDFINYILARMRIDLETGQLSIGAIRCVYYRVGTRHRVEKFFKQLRECPMPEGEYDVWDVVEYISSCRCKSEIERFARMSEKDECFELPESETKQEARMLHVAGRYFTGNDNEAWD